MARLKDALFELKEADIEVKEARRSVADLKAALLSANSLLEMVVRDFKEAEQEVIDAAGRPLLVGPHKATFYGVHGERTSGITNV